MTIVGILTKTSVVLVNADSVGSVAETTISKYTASERLRKDALVMISPVSLMMSNAVSSSPSGLSARNQEKRNRNVA